MQGAGTSVNQTTGALTLTPATTTTLGGVIAGSGITIQGNGTISAVPGGTLPPANPPGTLGGVKQGSNNAIATDGTLNVQSTIRTATANTTLLATDSFVDVAGFAGTITMPATPSLGQRITLANRNNNSFTLAAQAGATIAVYPPAGTAWTTAASVSIGGQAIVEFIFNNTTLIWIPAGSMFLPTGATANQPGLYGALYPPSGTVLGGAKSGSNVSIDASGAVNVGQASNIVWTSGGVVFQGGFAYTPYRFKCPNATNRIGIDTSTNGTTWYTQWGVDQTGMITHNSIDGNTVLTIAVPNAGNPTFACSGSSATEIVFSSPTVHAASATIPLLANGQYTIYFVGTSPNVALWAAWQDSSGIAYQKPL
jgi:hypothetical protein